MMTVRRPRHDAKTWWLGLAPAILVFAAGIWAGIVAGLLFLVCVFVHHKMMGGG